MMMEYTNLRHLHQVLDGSISLHIYPVSYSHLLPGFPHISLHTFQFVALRDRLSKVDDTSAETGKSRTCDRIGHDPKSCPLSG